jgi:RNA exonuclease 1
VNIDCLHHHYLSSSSIIKVLLDSLVAPGLPVSNARTEIHGITQEQLAGATFTLRHAQARLLDICHENTIIVGHALHHDLRALKVVHR